MLQNIFNTLAGGTNPANNNQPAGGDVLSGLLGSLMGEQPATQAPPAGNQQPAGGDMLGGLLGSLMGGQTGTPAPTPAGQVAANPLMALVGNGTNPMVNALIEPMVAQVALKLGIPEAVAMAAVTFAIQYMITTHGSKLANGEDMSTLLQQHASPKDPQLDRYEQGFCQTSQHPAKAGCEYPIGSF